MKKNLISIALLAIAVTVVIEIKNNKNAGQNCSACATGASTLPVPAGASVLENVSVQKPLPKLLDLGAGKCIPCKMMAPILDEMKQTFAGQLDVEFIDVWEDEDAGEQYGIRLIPTQIFFDSTGKELFRHEGFIAREDLLAKWAELGFLFAVDPQISEQGTSNSENE